MTSFCRDLGMQVYDAWSTDGLLVSQARDVRLFAVDDRRLLVQNKTLTFELDAAAAQAWRALRTPLTRPALVERMARRWRLSPDQTAREVGELLRVWKRYRLVKES